MKSKGGKVIVISQKLVGHRHRATVVEEFKALHISKREVGEPAEKVLHEPVAGENLPRSEEEAHQETLKGRGVQQHVLISLCGLYNST